MLVTRPLRFIPNIDIPMRDGTILRADILRPDDDAACPVILARTPYNKQNADPGRPWLAFAGAGYAVVVQDCRGRFASEGRFYPFRDEMNDGYDTVEWIAAQPWCTGDVGMFGTSYLGATQWLAAAAAPPHLRTIVPASTTDDYHNGWTYEAGAASLYFLLAWGMPFARADLERSDLPATTKRAVAEAIAHMKDNEHEVMAQLPLADLPGLSIPGVAPYFLDWIAHPDDDDYWKQWNISRHHPRITIPVLAIGSWYDTFLGGTLRNHTGMRARGGSELARRQQHVILGPWSHQRPLFGPNPDPVVSFGASSEGTAVGLDARAIRWFDRWLKGTRNGADDEPPVLVFTMGIDKWRTADAWPLPGTAFTDWYLHSAGAANSASGDGGLSPAKPGNERADTYVYDPARPVRTMGGCAHSGFGIGGGARDQRPVEARADVLVYTSAPMDGDLEVTGPVTVTLWAASTAPDTDFAAKLVDVAPDGLAVNLCDNIIRARYRRSLEQPEPIEPGRVYEYTIDLYGTSHVFRKGHRIRVDVTSSNYPRFDRNPNTGGPIAHETRLVPALQTVHHSSAHPSHVTLPVIQR